MAEKMLYLCLLISTFCLVITASPEAISFGLRLFTIYVPWAVRTQKSIDKKHDWMPLAGIRVLRHVQSKFLRRIANWGKKAAYPP